MKKECNKNKIKTAETKVKQAVKKEEKKLLPCGCFHHDR